MHQRSRHWHFTDYVITWNKDGQDVRMARAMCGATVHHRLVLVKCKLRIPPIRRPQGQNTAKGLNVSRLKSSQVAEYYSSGLEGRLPVTPQDGQDNIEEQWEAFRDAVYLTACEHLGLTTAAIRTGSMRIRKRNRHCCKKNTNCSENFRMNSRYKQGKMPL